MALSIDGLTKKEKALLDWNFNLVLSVKAAVFDMENEEFGTKEQRRSNWRKYFLRVVENAAKERFDGKEELEAEKFHAKMEPLFVV